MQYLIFQILVDFIMNPVQYDLLSKHSVCREV